MKHSFIALFAVLSFSVSVCATPASAAPTGPRPVCTGGKRPTIVTQQVKGSNWTCKYNKFGKSYSGTSTNEGDALDRAKSACRAGGSGASGPNCEVNGFYACGQQTVEVWACN